MKPGFKEILFQDTKRTFLNPEEFGEWHTVDGRRMVVSIDGMEVIERAKKQTEHGRIDGVFKQQIVLYAARSDFGSLPAIGRSLKMDKSIFRVVDAIDESGIYSITLEAVKS